MFIKFNSGISGIEKYLEDGQKNGQRHNRNELDKRVALSGSLGVLQHAIHAIENDGCQRYFHI